MEIRTAVFGKEVTKFRDDIGADGCIAKPVYTDQILSFMRVCFFR